MVNMDEIEDNTTHKIRILKTLLNTGLELTATHFGYVSNANKYFSDLENQGLITSKWGKLGKARVKFRFVAPHQKEKAEKYLESIFGSNNG